MSAKENFSRANFFVYVTKAARSEVNSQTRSEDGELKVLMSVTKTDYNEALMIRVEGITWGLMTGWEELMARRAVNSH